MICRAIILVDTTRVTIQPVAVGLQANSGARRAFQRSLCVTACTLYDSQIVRTATLSQ